MKKQNVLVVGLGNMGGSLVSGLLLNAPKYAIRVFDIDKAKSKQWGDAVEFYDIRKDSHLLECDVLFLCIKPQDFSEFCLHHAKIESQTLIVSTLAGKTTDQIEKELNFSGPIIRCMPNIAATVSEAATVLTKNAKVKETHVEIIESIFSSIGTAHWVKEPLMDAVTGLSGSGPAYVYLFIEGLADGGVKMGLPRQLALALATQTVLGAAKLVKQSGLHPAVLRDQVVTPAGTTIAGLHELEKHGIRAMLMDAVSAGTLRSQQLREK